LRLVRRRCEENACAAVVVTHDINLAADFADLVMLLKAGRLIASGPSQTVLKPDLLAETFGVKVLVDAHPLTGAPRITPIYTQE